MIIKPALSPGNTALDPDGDGYVSQKTNGIQLGFTTPPNDDVLYSEIPYVNMDRLDPVGDLLRGPIGSFSEIVGIDAAGNYAIMWYSDGTNLMYRFRLDNFAPNSKSYSILLDTDGKFGFTGVNADPNAVTGNPGFEAEIVLETNFNVKAYNVDGVTSGTVVASYNYDTNCQKSIAVSTTGGNPDYFYDFYIPFSSISTLFNASTPLRHISLTSMNPQPAIGNNAQSDVGGMACPGSLDQQFICLITPKTPTAPGATVLDRSACPTINPLATSSTAISGTSTEASGTTIVVNVYQSDGVTLIGSGTTTTSGNSWTINISSFSPSVTMALGQIVKATATVSGKGTSEDNCSTQTVTGCAGDTSTSGVTLTKINGGKGYIITNTFAAGTIFTWYNADYTLATYPDKSGSTTNIINPQTSATNSQTITFSTQTGQTFPNGVYYFTYQEPGKCVSNNSMDCQYSLAGTSVAPVISTSPIVSGTTSVSGTCGSSAGTFVSLYADGVLLKSTNVVNSTSWTISGLNLTNSNCSIITATATDAGKCSTQSVSGVAVTHTGTKPTFVTNGCSPTNPVTSVSGNSNDADGTTITLYKTNPSRTAVGTGTVANGAWTITGLNLVSGDNVVAAVSGGSCVATGPDSDSITISNQTSLSGYTITIDTPTEGQSFVSGTISGATYPVTLKTYIDQSQIGDGITVNGPGNWNVGHMLSTDLYTGGTVNISLTASGSCKSALSQSSAIVICSPPQVPTYTGGSFPYCKGGIGTISILTSEAYVAYQLVDGNGVAVGPSSSAITLTTYALNADPIIGPYFVKAFKIADRSCAVISSVAIYYDTRSISPTVTFSNTNVSVSKGTTVVNLPFAAKSSSPSADTYTISYSIAAKVQGFLDVTSPTAIPSAPGNFTLTVPANAVPGSYTGTITVATASGSSCTSYYDFTITVYDPAAPPVISSQPSNVTICSGNSTTLGITAVNASSYQWQSATVGIDGPYTSISGATSTTYTIPTTPPLTSKTYYRVIVSNASGSTISIVASVFVTNLPLAGPISGSSTICAGQSALVYSIPVVSGANSYTWTYSGSNVTITETSNVVTLSFASNATSGTLSVTANNSCGSGTAATIAINVSPTPFINNITTNLCSGSTFTFTPVNSTNGIVPSGTTYSWSAPVVTGGITGGASGNGSSISGTLINPTGTIQTATYTVTPVKGSCTGSAFTLTVIVNPPISLTATPINANCNSGSTGGVNVSVSGGTPPFTYAWTGPSFTATTQNLSGLSAGTYNLTVTDGRGCTAVTSAVVSQPTVISITPTITDILCNGQNTGSISIAVSGGTAPYTYLWNDGSASQDRTSLAAGTYSVTVTDANGCTNTSSGNSITQPTTISASASASAISCNGGTSTITVTASGGTGILNYSLNGGAFQAGNTFNSVTASGSPYSITVRDANNCTAATSVAVSQPAVLDFSTAVTNASCPGISDGAITLTAIGGTTPYTYLWAGGSTTSVRTSLPAGSYNVTVTDAKNCTATTSVTITNTNTSPATPGTIAK